MQLRTCAQSSLNNLAMMFDTNMYVAVTWYNTFFYTALVTDRLFKEQSIRSLVHRGQQKTKKYYVSKEQLNHLVILQIKSTFMINKVIPNKRFTKASTHVPLWYCFWYRFDGTFCGWRKKDNKEQHTFCVESCLWLRKNRATTFWR